jgi:hypothetical protein
MELNRCFILNQEDFLHSQETIYFELKNSAPQNGRTGQERELRVLAGVLAYFQFSSKRVIDVIPMYCSMGLMTDFGEAMRKGFQRKLGVTGTLGLQNCKRFAQDDQNVRERRQELRTKVKIVDDASELLANIYY